MSAFGFESKSKVIRSPSEATTMEVGATLARTLPEQPPARALRVNLTGDLGAGKTTLVRGLLRELGVQGPVRSPTYSLFETYRVPPWTVCHLDLYRLADPADFAFLGLADHDESYALWLIEWPERAGSALPAPDLEIRLSGDSDGHMLEMRACTGPGVRLLDKL